MNKVIDLKGSILSLTVLKLFSNDIEQTKQALEQKVSQAPDFFVGIPVVLEPEVGNLDPTFLALLVELLHQKQMIPIGIRTEDESIKEQANYAGLAVFSGEAKVKKRSKPEKSDQKENCSGLKSAMVINHAVRSGQQIYAKDRDLIVMGSVNPGAEIIADGNVHVYGTIRGKVFAGSQGETSARIFAQKIDAELVCIAGLYQLSEDILPEYKQGFIEVSLLNEQLNFKSL
ncbi:MAG: septum site-determining protein MinC [Thiomicrorhabdus chilensis]|uniref:septum site-determining protein MinC n=1 Tax=Thiomicrorhabdus chilensis TaxID=63656 RepID=UPI00299CE617|nr:septum site-determining protein MinC [Thiomicrorhabdus chilensis]MDX1348441.1 septum site-determining protein MinC [Thiomicrorhabdus chilensis]